jgi:hypothetical protein
MEITGSSSTVRYVDVTGKQTLEFRLNQRVTAEVLKVSGDQVDLVIRGTRVVGRLISGDTASALSNQRTSQFLVKGMANGVLQLQMVSPQSSAAAATPSQVTSQWTILAQNLLQLNNLPQNQENIMIGRSLLSLGLPITPELLDTAKLALNGLGNWGQPEADLAAALLSNGLPLSSGTLNLALQRLPSLVDALTNLQARLTQMLNSTIPRDLKTLAEQALLVLQNGTLDWSAPAPEMMKQIGQAISIWGKSIESHLADAINDSEANNPEAMSSGLMAMAQLRRGLAQKGDSALINEIDRFMDSIRQMQFNNTSQKSDPTNPPWLVIDLPLTGAWMPKSTMVRPDMHSANLRIAYRSDENGKAIDPDNNRLILKLDLDYSNTIEIDLSMVGKRVGAWMTVSTDEWRQLVEKELPSLQTGLEELGYHMQFAKCEVKPTMSLTDLNSTVSKLNLEA